MSVVIETTLGDITVDLFIKERPTACLNFLKLCKIKYYNYNLFHTVSRRFIAQTGDPTGTRNGGESIFGVLEGPHKRFFGAETNPRIKHTVKGLISFVGNEDNMIGSQFFFTLGDECDDLTYLDDKHCVFGEVAEGLDVVELINEAICDTDDRPYQDIRITHTVVLDDPFPDLDGMFVPSRSPSPSAERLQGGRIAPDEEIDEIAGKTAQEVNEMIAEREAKARATILEMVGDLPDADMAPPENVLFVCKLNPVTSDDDLEIIFSRFGKIKSCEVIRDHKTGDSLQYAFIEFEDKKCCEEAYFKMDNVLIDDRRIHVDFSQSVSKVKWMGKGRGVKHFPENGSHKKTGQFEENNRRKNNKNRRNYTRNSPSPGRIERRRTRRSRSRSQPRRNRSSPEPRNFKNRSNRRSKSPTNEYKKNRDRRESESRNRRRPRSRSVSPKNKKKYKNTKRTRTPERRKNKNNKSRSSSPPKKNRKRMSRSSSSSSGSSTPKNKRSQTPKKIKTKTNRSTYRKSRSHSPKTNKTRRSRSRSLTPKDKRNRSPSEKIKTKKNKSSYRSPSRSPEPKRNKTRRRSRSTSSGSLSPKDKRSSSPSVKSKTKKSISYKTNRSRSPEHKTTRNRRRSRSESRSQTPERNKMKSRKNKSGKRRSKSTSPEYKKRRSSSSSSDRSTTRKTKQRRNR